MKYKFSIILIFFLFLLLQENIQANDSEPTPDLYIESKTAEYSAQCMIDGKNTATDKDRTNIGVGETVNLELKGKRLGEVTSVTWKVEPNEESATVKPKKGEMRKAILEAVRNKKTNGSATIQVTTNIDAQLNPPGPRQKTFTILVPEGISAKHSGRRIPGFPLDGDKMNPGASSVLILTINPLSVSFSNISITEEAQQGDGHNTSGNVRNPDNRNEIKYDYIGRKTQQTIEDAGLQSFLSSEQKTEWQCGWYTYVDDEHCCHISGKNFIQMIKMERDGQRNSFIYELKTTASKFGVSTSRSTEGNAKHQDKDDSSNSNQERS